MSLRQRILPTMTISSNSKNDDEFSRLKNRVSELEVVVSNLRNLLDISRFREKKLSTAIEQSGVTVSLDLEAGVIASELENDPAFSFAEAESRSFFSAILERGGWLIGLLIFQSCSSFILSANNKLLEAHPAIIYFLTSKF